MQRLLITSFVFASCIDLLSAQSLSGPVDGYLFDAPTSSFRAVMGFPGSALLGPAILSSFAYGSVAPQKDYGLGLQDGQSSLVTGLSSAIPSMSPLPGIASGFDGVVWAGDGSLSVLYSHTGAWIETLTGLPNAPVAGPVIDLSSLGGSLSALCVDAGGKQIAAGIAGDAGGVYLISDGGVPAPVLSIAKPMALAFSGDGSRLYALDGATLSVTAISLTGLAPQTLTLDGMTDP